MSSKKRKIVLIVSIISVFSVLFAAIAATALSNGGISDLWNNAANKDGVVKYEKPSVGDIAQDGAYPDEVISNVSNEYKEKQWYEYITYSKKPLKEIVRGNEKLIVYDPYDYNYGTIMKFSNPESNFGDYYDSEGYTTANEIQVTYTKSKSSTWSHGWNIDLGFEETINGSGLIVEAGMKFSQNIGYNGSWTGSNDSSASKTVTYNALYFNSNGTPYRWRVVKYTVYLPLYCEYLTLVNGEWVFTDSNYCLLATVEGTCREWIENVAYIEDWRNGEPVKVEDFWGEFFKDENALINAYLNNMIPIN